MILYSPLIQRTLAITLLIWCVVSLPLPGQASDFIDYFRDLFFPPSQPGTAGSNKSGGARNECPSTEATPLPLTAFVPRKNKGKTTESNPTLWFYIPYTAQDFHAARLGSKSIEFILINAVEHGTEQGYEPVNLELLEQPGLFSVQIPQSTPLQVGNRYRWVLSVICNPNNRSADATVNGWIERVELDDRIQTELAAIDSPEEKIRFYAGQGLWYEMLTHLIKYYHLNNPRDENAIAIRDELFGFVGLCQLASKQPVEYCPPEK